MTSSPLRAPSVTDLYTACRPTCPSTLYSAWRISSCTAASKTTRLRKPVVYNRLRKKNKNTASKVLLEFLFERWVPPLGKVCRSKKDSINGEQQARGFWTSVSVLPFPHFRFRTSVSALQRFPLALNLKLWRCWIVVELHAVITFVLKWQLVLKPLARSLFNIVVMTRKKERIRKIALTLPHIFVFSCLLCDFWPLTSVLLITKALKEEAWGA